MEDEEIKKEAPGKPDEPEKAKQEDKQPEQKTEKAPEPPSQPSDSTELNNLKAENAKLRIERTAALEAVKMGVDPKQIDYVLKLAEFPENADSKGITAAIQKVLDTVPAFKNSTSSGSKIRIGAEEPKANSNADALSKAFGNAKH